MLKLTIKWVVHSLQIRDSGFDLGIRSISKFKKFPGYVKTYSTKTNFTPTNHIWHR